MTTITRINQSLRQEILAAQRPRLLGLCAFLTGDPDSAEDIVQEVMLEAWRSFEKLRNPDAVEAWLNGIVRNVCTRWRRTRGRESAVMLHDEQAEAGPDSMLEAVADDFDLEVELDRQEIAILLDRAMALLPETTRDVLVYKYIAESRHAEIANQLGLTPSAVTMRLKRGKLALRKLLTTELRTEAEAFDLATPSDIWVETRIWCAFCGQRCLMGLLTESRFVLRCPACSIEPNAFLANANWPGIESPFGELKSFRAILKRHGTMMFNYFTNAVVQGESTCAICNLPLPLHLYQPEWVPPSIRDMRGMHTTCERCDLSWQIALVGFAFTSPEGLAFFQSHPRLRVLPEREVELNGVPAIVLSFESVTDPATFDMLVHRDTYTILASHRSDGT